MVQLDKLPDNLTRRRRSFELTSGWFAKWPHLFTLPRLTDGVETGWHMFPILIKEGSGISRSEYQRWMETRGMTPGWCGPAT